MKYIKPLFFLTFILLISGLFFFLPSFIKVNHIECKSQYGPCGSSTENKIKAFSGSSLKDAKVKIKNLLKNEKGIEDFSTQYKIPDKLIVYIVETKPKFALRGEDKPFFALVDKEGVVLRLEETTILPFVEIAGEIPNVGEDASAKEIFALNLIYDIYSTYQIQKGKIKDNSLIIDMNDPVTVIFPLEGDKDSLLGSLAVILAKLKGESNDARIGVRVIDLRFKNPVLR